MTIEFASLPGGRLRMGSDEGEIAGYLHTFAYAFRRFPAAEPRDWFRKQTPAFDIDVPPFDMARWLVTRGEFRAFERATGRRPSALSEGDTELPVEGVTFAQSLAFCAWLSRERGERIALPTEAQWEFAASSGGRYPFPWGDAWDPRRANTAETGPGRATRAGAFARGCSAHGIEDLAGNLEEWTCTPYAAYPGGPEIRDHILAEQGAGYPVLRGGSYALNGDLCLATRRHGFRDGWAVTGLRIVRDATKPALRDPSLSHTDRS